MEGVLSEGVLSEGVLSGGGLSAHHVNDNDRPFLRSFPRFVRLCL